MNSLTFHIPAKINLYLRLTGKRADGYNNLCTVFQKIGLYDYLTIRKKTAGFHLTVQGNLPCAYKDTTIYKAYRLMKQRTRFRGGVSIDLVKRIPSGSGLGGASADAAFTLMGINKLFNLSCKQSSLLDLGSKIGADVPLFVQPYPRALGIDRGDILIDLPRGKRFWVLLAVFDKPLSTQIVYQNFTYLRRSQISLTKLSREVKILSRFLQEGDIPSLGKAFKNDLTAVACSLMPEVKGVFRLMKHYGFPAYAMTGSGPTVFALFARKADVQAAEKRLLQYTRGITTIVCQTIS